MSKREKNMRLTLILSIALLMLLIVFSSKNAEPAKNVAREFSCCSGKKIIIRE